MEREKALNKAGEYFNIGAFEADLARRVSYKTESNLAGCESALAGYLDGEMIPYLSALGFDCETYPNPRDDAGPFWLHAGGRVMICPPF